MVARALKSEEPRVPFFRAGCVGRRMVPDKIKMDPGFLAALGPRMTAKRGSDCFAAFGSMNDGNARFRLSHCTRSSTTRISLDSCNTSRT